MTIWSCVPTRTSPAGAPTNKKRKQPGRTSARQKTKDPRVRRRTMTTAVFRHLRTAPARPTVVSTRRPSPPSDESRVRWPPRRIGASARTRAPTPWTPKLCRTRKNELAGGLARSRRAVFGSRGRCRVRGGGHQGHGRGRKGRPREAGGRRLASAAPPEDARRRLPAGPRSPPPSSRLPRLRSRRAPRERGSPPARCPRARSPREAISLEDSSGETSRSPAPARSAGRRRLPEERRSSRSRGSRGRPRARSPRLKRGRLQRGALTRGTLTRGG